MKVAINDQVFDSEDVVITLIFDNDEQRRLVASHLSHMPEAEGIRLYSSYPKIKHEVEEIEQLLNYLQSGQCAKETK